MLLEGGTFPQLELREVTKRFRGGGGVHEATRSWQAFRCLALLGPSGGGKSTLLRLLAGLLLPDSGEIRWHGRSLGEEANALRAHRRRLGVVFQDHNLFPHLTVQRNITLPLEEVHGMPAFAARDTAMDWLHRLGLEQLAGRYPSELSGGQRQRVAIARAVAPKPELLLLDEPTSALDPIMAGEVLALLEQLNQQGCPMVLVTHALGFARAVADEVAFVAGGEIVESAAAGKFFAEAQSPLVRRFLRSAHWQGLEAPR